MSTDHNDCGSQGGHFHAVRFYENDEALCRIVAEFVGEGFAKREPAIIIATPEHRTEIERQLRERGFDLDTLTQRRDVLMLDARETLATFCEFGDINPREFRHVITAAIERVCKAADGQGRVVRAFGEMVDLLWKDGLTAASVRLETLWNQLANTHDFKLLCGYSMGNFYKDAAQDAIVRTHTHVVSSGGETQAVAHTDDLRAQPLPPSTVY